MKFILLVLLFLQSGMCYGYMTDVVQGYTKLPYRRCLGNSVEQLTERTSKSCADKCNRRLDCIAFVTKDYTISSTNCYLRTECSSPTTSYDYMLYKRLKLPGCNFMAVNGYAIYGHNQKIFLESTIDFCKQQCITNHVWCNSFDFISAKKICLLSPETRETVPTRFGKHSGSIYIQKNCGTDIDNWKPPEDILNNTKAEVITEGSLCFLKYGPLGVKDLATFTDRSMITDGRITALEFNTYGRLVCLAVTYGSKKSVCHGGHNALQATPVKLASDEYITGMDGYKDNQLPPRITQLTFITNKRTIGPYGEAQGTKFFVNSNGKTLAYITGRTSSYLNSLNLYFHCQ